MPRKQKINLVHDVLDKLVVDHQHDPIGRVDSLVLALEDGRPPRVARVEIGSAVLGRRLHPRIGRWIRNFAHRFGVHNGSPTRIAWSKLKLTGIEIEADVQADRTNALAWEHWLREHIVIRVPGGGKK
jgi:hypothetical protein